MTNELKLNIMKTNILIISGAILLIGILPLSFHFTPATLNIHWKNQLTYKNTIILQEDVEMLITRYNITHPEEKYAVRSEPLFRKLWDRGILFHSSVMGGKLTYCCFGS